MLEFDKRIESCNVVLGLLLNSLLLFLIFRYSKPQLGNYRNLLKIFATNDILLVINHAIVQPTSFTSGSIVAVFSRSFPDVKQLMSISSGFMTIPFSLMNVNFLHRFLSVKRYCAALSVAENEAGKKILQHSISVSGVTIGDGWLIVHYWDKGILHIPGLLTLIGAGSIMLSNLVIGGVLCSLTISHLKTEITFSPSYKTYQFKILRALFAQSAIPIVLNYIPAGLGLTIPLFMDVEGDWIPGSLLFRAFRLWMPLL